MTDLVAARLVTRAGREVGMRSQARALCAFEASLAQQSQPRPTLGADAAAATAPQAAAATATDEEEDD